MSLLTLQKGLGEIKATIVTMTDADLRGKLHDMGFKVVPNHFISELRKHL